MKWNGINYIISCLVATSSFYGDSTNLLVSKFDGFLILQFGEEHIGHDRLNSFCHFHQKNQVRFSHIAQYCRFASSTIQSSQLMTLCDTHLDSGKKEKPSKNNFIGGKNRNPKEEHQKRDFSSTKDRHASDV